MCRSRVSLLCTLVLAFSHAIKLHYNERISLLQSGKCATHFCPCICRGDTLTRNDDTPCESDSDWQFCPLPTANKAWPCVFSLKISFVCYFLSFASWVFVCEFPCLKILARIGVPRARTNPACAKWPRTLPTKVPLRLGEKIKRSTTSTDVKSLGTMKILTTGRFFSHYYENLKQFVQKVAFAQLPTLRFKNGKMSTWMDLF